MQYTHSTIFYIPIVILVGIILWLYRKEITRSHHLNTFSSDIPTVKDTQDRFGDFLGLLLVLSVLSILFSLIQIVGSLSSTIHHLLPNWMPIFLTNWILFSHLVMNLFSTAALVGIFLRKRKAVYTYFIILIWQLLFVVIFQVGLKNVFLFAKQLICVFLYIILMGWAFKRKWQIFR